MKLILWDRRAIKRSPELPKRLGFAEFKRSSGVAAVGFTGTVGIRKSIDGRET